MTKEDTKQKGRPPFTFPEMRVINENLFERDQYNAEAKPTYKVEVAIPKNTTDPVWADLIDELFSVAVEKWGKKFAEDNQLDIDGGTIQSCILDGDKLAADREARGKKGDAYKGNWVIRSGTQYNKEGVEGPGGIDVWAPDLSAVQPANRGTVYNGCFGHVAAKAAAYEGSDRTGKYYGVKFYLVAFQKSKDGEKLMSSTNTQTLFKAAAGRTEGGGVSRRSARG